MEVRIYNSLLHCDDKTAVFLEEEKLIPVLIAKNCFI